MDFFLAVDPFSQSNRFCVSAKSPAARAGLRGDLSEAAPFSGAGK